MLHRHSDHCPLLLTTIPPHTKVHGSRPFRFDDHWICYDSCRTIVQNEWSSLQCNDLPIFATKLDMCGKALDNWSRFEMSELRIKIFSLEKVLSS